MNASSHNSENENRENEEGNVVTMVDVLEEEKELEEDANAVLGGADDKNCTYSKGYVFRQPLYACATCNSPGSEKAGGICLACSYRCHEGHELIELYTKRNFRCDCGNSCFKIKCQLEPIKDEVNTNNSYNQNFMGTYCICKRPYPDPEDPVEDEMIQCVICEDWFHKRHLKTDKVPTDFDEMICQDCMQCHSFLWKYSNLSDTEIKSLDESLNSVRDTIVKNEESKENDTDDTVKKCYLKVLNKTGGSGATFWSDGWRKHLCKCAECLVLYEKENVSFLLNEADTVQHYENKNKELMKESQYEKGLKALSSLDRIKQVEAIESYNEMKAELMGYLQKFAANKKIVREEDIHEFFNQMQARKKHKVEVPYFCH